MKEKEHQSIEWKESWQDEYLKWICGYANAYGGTIYIGTDDDGNVVGIDNARDLLERIPNKITDTMGIIVDVNLLYKGELEYLQIIVDKYPSLISFHGKYYYRSGSTMREITGKELERALLKTQGRTWDGVPLPKLSVSDLKQDAIQLFKDKAVKRGRLTKEEVSVEDTILMDNLHLIDEDGYLIRAAMLAFYKDPEKWVTGSYIKIGYFGKSDSDLVYQDEVHGPLIEQVDKTVDLVYTKYMKALIDYEGVQRIEQFMFHKDAFREILLNAIVHKDYSSCNPIQISVYKDKIYIWNDGEMPPNLDSTDKLFMKHSSKPYNPKLANVFFKACDRYLGLLRNDGQHHGQCDQEGDHDEEQDIMRQIIAFCMEPKTASEIMQKFNLERSYFRRHYLNKMLKTGKLQRTEPDKPKSKNQKYYS